MQPALFGTTVTQGRPTKTVRAVTSVSWRVRPEGETQPPAPASFRGFYFRSPVPYMPGDKLTCIIECRLDATTGETVCIEYLVEVLRMDSDGNASDFGIVCFLPHANSTRETN